MNQRRRLDIVNEVLALIEQSPLTRDSIARRAGISGAAISLWESGKTVNPSLPGLVKVARALDMQIAMVEGRYELTPLKPAVEPARTRPHIRRSWLGATARW